MRLPGTVEFSYDKDSDVLYFYVEKPRPAVTENYGDGILIRRDLDTNEVVGFTIVGYASLKKRGPVHVPFFEEVALP